MKNVLILHGAANNSKGNWFPWLKIELEKKGYTVWSPDLPHNENPHRDEWVNFIISNKEWKFNNESIIVGHSAGGTLALRLLETLPEGVAIDKAILVSTYVEMGDFEFTYPYKKDMLDIPFNWEKIKKSCNQFYFIHSNNDPYQCGDTQGKILHTYLGGELIIKKDQGHFNLEVGDKYKEFPELLNYI